MSDEPSLTPDRVRLLAEADELFEVAESAARSARWTCAFFWECMTEAACKFDHAGVKYREAGLGAKARRAYTRAAECRRELAQEEEHFARESEKERDKILHIALEEEEPVEGNEEADAQ
jgi:hypothetical protein